MVNQRRCHTNMHLRGELPQRKQASPIQMILLRTRRNIIQHALDIKRINACARLEGGECVLL